jgi:hypothetical protein
MSEMKAIDARNKRFRSKSLWIHSRLMFWAAFLFLAPGAFQSEEGEHQWEAKKGTRRFLRVCAEPD